MIKLNYNLFLLLFFLTSIFISVGMSGCAKIGTDELNTEPKIVIPKPEPLVYRANKPYVVFKKLYVPYTHIDKFSETGIASWYGKKFHGKKTSIGEIYNMYQYSAAHKLLPLPSYIRVTNLDNQKELVVRVNDRGPFVGERILDLSYAAAKNLDFVEQGTTKVKIEVLQTGEPEKISNKNRNKKTYLQAGAFTHEANAIQIKRKLISNGFSASIKKNKKHLFVVKVGPYENAQRAFAKLPKLEQIIEVPAILLSE